MLRFDRNLIGDLKASLEGLGLNVSRRNESWLLHDYINFTEIKCSTEEECIAYAYASYPKDPQFKILVYPNMLNNKVCGFVRTYLEDEGAEWSYFR